jgi:hypothetical protein
MSHIGISFQLSAFSYQLSAISFQLSAISFQLSVCFRLRRQLFAFSLRLRASGFAFGLRAQFSCNCFCVLHRYGRQPVSTTQAATQRSSVRANWYSRLRMLPAVSESSDIYKNPLPEIFSYNGTSWLRTFPTCRHASCGRPLQACANFDVRPLDTRPTSYA